MKYLTLFVFRVMLGVVLLSPGFTVQADRDHDEARRLHSSGDILSLEQILEKVRRSHPGKVLEVELETESGQMVYEIEMLGDDGVVRELIVDARSGEILRSKLDD